VKISSKNTGGECGEKGEGNNDLKLSRKQSSLMHNSIQNFDKEMMYKSSQQLDIIELSLLLS